MLTPDRSFTNKLREIDKNLGCHYNQDHHHFVVTYRRAVGDPVPIYLVKAEDGGFRHPDMRDVNAILEGDTHRVSVKDRLQRVAKYMEDTREKTRAAARDNIRGMTKDDKIQLANTFGRVAGAGKGNATFRRINLKPKGKAFSN